MKISADDFRQRLLPILLGQAVGLACGTVGVKLTSRLVSPDDYGIYGVFTSLVPIGAGVVYIGLVKFVQRHWQDSPDRPALARELLRALGVRLPFLIGAAVVAVLFTSPLRSWSFTALLLVSALLLSLTALAQAALQAMRAHWRDLGVSATLSVTRSFLPPLLYTASALGSRALLLGFALQTAAGALLGVLTLRPWWPRKTGAPVAPQLAVAYTGLQFTTLAVAGWIIIGMNRWLVAWFHGNEAAGYFTLAGNIGILVPTMLGTLFLQYCQPGWFAHGSASLAARRELLREVDRAALIFTAATGLLLLALQFALPALVGPLVNARYLPAIGFVIGTGAFALSTMLGVFYHTLLLAAKREADCTRADYAGAACYVAGSVISAIAGLAWFKVWLLFSPGVPWVVNRTVARRMLLRGT